MHMLLSRWYVRNFAFYEYPLRVPVTSTIMAFNNYVVDNEFSSAGPVYKEFFKLVYTCNLRNFVRKVTHKRRGTYIHAKGERVAKNMTRTLLPLDLCSNLTHF